LAPKLNLAIFRLFYAYAKSSARHVPRLVDAAPAGFTEVTPGVETPGPPALPSLAMDAWGFRIFLKMRR
jgi:hypothetical protein